MTPLRQALMNAKDAILWHHGIEPATVQTIAELSGSCGKVVGITGVEFLSDSVQITASLDDPKWSRILFLDFSVIDAEDPFKTARIDTLKRLITVREDVIFNILKNYRDNLNELASLQVELHKLEGNVDDTTTR